MFKSFNRRATIVFQSGILTKVITNPYKIDFDITKSVGGTFSSGSITITGLTSVDIVAIMSSYDYNSKVLLPNVVTLTAGYDIGIQSIIFIGSAQYAKPSLDTPSKSISLEVTSAYYSSEAFAVSVSYENVTLSTIVMAISTKLGLALNFSAIDKVIPSYTFQGQVFAQLDGLRRMFKDTLFYINGSTLCVENVDIPGINAPILCSVENGMIGTPEITYLGCNVKMLLNPLVNPGSLVKVISQRLPVISGNVFRAMNVRHTGSTRDSYYYTEIECSRFL